MMLSCHRYHAVLYVRERTRLLAAVPLQNSSQERYKYYTIIFWQVIEI
jgi:hypothetical protein